MAKITKRRLVASVCHTRYGGCLWQPDRHGKTYLTIAICIAFILTSLIPALVILVTTDAKLVDLADLLIADIRASVWGSRLAIDSVLGRQPPLAHPGWRRYIAFHPNATDRRRAVADPAILFRIGFWDAFGLGIAAWFALDSMQGLLLGFAPNSTIGFFLFMTAVNVVVPAVVVTFVAGALGVAIWRSAFAALMTGLDPYRGTGRLALAVISGYLLVDASYALLGWLTSLSDPAFPLSELLAATTAKICAGVIVMAACALIFRWIPAAASAWLSVAFRSKSPGPAVAGTIAATVILLTDALVSAAVLVALILIVAKFPPTGNLYLYGQLAGIPLLFATITAWSFPLSATLWRRARSAGPFPQWAFLESPAVPLPAQEPLQLRRAAAVGLLVALGFCVLVEATYFHRLFPGVIGDGILAAFQSFSWWMVDRLGPIGAAYSLPAAFAQALASGVVAARAKRLGVVCGLFASSVAGLVLVVFQGLFFGPDETLGAWALASLMLCEMGAIAALPVAAAVSSGKMYYWRFDAKRMNKNEAGAAGAHNSASQHIAGRPLRIGPAMAAVAVLLAIVMAGTAARISDVVVAARQAHRDEIAAAGGDPNAQNRLGSSYAQGNSVIQDDRQAVAWFRKARSKASRTRRTIWLACTRQAAACLRMTERRCDGSRRQLRKVMPVPKTASG